MENINFPWGNCIEKKTIFPEKGLKFREKSCILQDVVTLIAKKREVAAHVAGFPWSECQVMKLATSHCIQINQVRQRAETRV